MTIAAVTHECPNCGAGVEEAFCARCGQKVCPLDPSLRDLLHSVLDEVLNLDGRIFQSLRLLLIRPGFLTREHVEGRRVRYVSPIRLYLLFSVLYFAVAAFAPVQFVRITSRPSDSPQEIRRLEEQKQKVETAAGAAIGAWAPRVMFVLVPLFAGFVALAVRAAGRNYPHHLYFALHLHAVWFFAAALSAGAQIRTIPLITAAVPQIARLYGAWYFVVAFRRAYGLSTGGAILRSLAVGAAYAVVVIAVLFAIFRLGVFGAV